MSTPPSTHSMVTIAAPLGVERIDDALALIRAMGNPAQPDIQAALDRLDIDDGIHFMSLHAIAPTNPASKTGHLVLEISADGAEGAAIARVADRIGARLRPIFELSTAKPGADLAAYFSRHALTLGVGWTGRTGLPFCGTPGMSVGRIRREAVLGDRLAAEVERQGGAISALDRLKQVRAAIGADPDYAWALETPEPPPPSPNVANLIGSLIVDFAKVFLWPLAIPLAIVVIYGLWQGGAALWSLFAARLPLGDTLWALLRFTGVAFSWSFEVFLAFAIPLVIVASALYFSLRAKETTDPVETRAPRRETLRDMLAGENHYAQNHMVSIAQRKPGLTRRITTRLVFWVIGAMATRSFEPGHLGGIGTIHFARWVMLPGGRDFVFFSNFGGSWESYLEDFITKAHAGLTAVWSNSVGFPVTRNLFELGATDGERFKRFARHSMTATPFWYSAYPTLTTDNIRSHAAVRRGLAAAKTDEEAISWLAQFGSSQRPLSKLESNQIQSLVFGGLGFMKHGEVLIVDLGADRAGIGGWLKTILPEVAFDDGRRLGRDAVITLALGPGALAGAGLPASALETFPAAFLDGMTGPGRARILGDDDATLDQWWWGADRQHDAALLIYGVSDAAVAALSAKVRASAEAHGHRIAVVLPLRPVPAEVHEVFGFLDGVSQPVIRGTYQGLRKPDPIHLVEAGEFVLGYPDNRGNLPPGPTMDAAFDPENRLPIRCDGGSAFAGDPAAAPREIARNGTFLVIRQLEQDRDAFWAYCETEAAKLRQRLPAPYVIDKDFIGAKMIGRWPNGSSLVRNPYLPYGAPSLAPTNPMRRPESNPGGLATPIASPSTPANLKPAGADPDAADNDYLFGAEDPQGLRCPYGAHIRRANPRDSLDPGSRDQIDISNRHRIMRVGRGYAPKDGQKPGLLFMCLNGDLERQFEFVQQTWLNSETFHGLSGERDPLAGNTGVCSAGFTIPTRDGPVRLAPLSRFVTPRGGGYFFVPGRKLLEFLSG